MIFIVGGIRSGKSLLAEEVARRLCHPVYYLATARRAGDPEMRARIAAHKARRPAGWATLEVPTLTELQAAVTGASPGATLLIDSLTLVVADLLTDSPSPPGDAVEKDLAGLCTACRRYKGQVIVVSDEVGLGGVSPNGVARSFADHLGQANQHFAQASSHIFECRFSRALTLKGNKKLLPSKLRAP